MLQFLVYAMNYQPQGLWSMEYSECCVIIVYCGIAFLFLHCSLGQTKAVPSGPVKLWCVMISTATRVFLFV
jgi:hypothetical protein